MLQQNSPEYARDVGRLPVDLAFGLPVSPPQSLSHSQYDRDLLARLEEGYQLALENAAKSMEKE